MKCGNVKECRVSLENANLAHRFFQWYQWAKATLIYIGAPPWYALDHQVSSDQEFGLATKSYAHTM